MENSNSTRGSKTLLEFEALSFDCYGTLIDWEAGISKVLMKWAQNNQVNLSQEELLEIYSKHEANSERECPRLLYPEILSMSFKALALELDKPVTDEELAEFSNSVPEWPAFGDSQDALARLAKHFKLIILSNVDHEGFAGSNKHLKGNFSAVLTAQDIGSYKPSMRNFEALEVKIAELGIEKSKLLHVAQSLFHDHLPAKQIGLPTVWINRRHDTPGWGATPEPSAPVKPDWEFKSMKDFADAVDNT